VPFRLRDLIQYIMARQIDPNALLKHALLRYLFDIRTFM
jgi:hypothetical protein